MQNQNNEIGIGDFPMPGYLYSIFRIKTLLSFIKIDG